LLNCFQNSLKHSICISKNVIVPETQNAKSAASQVGITNLIGCIVGVLTSVRFNNKHLFERNEVNDPGADGDLSAEFRIRELPRTKRLPKLGFSVRRCVTKMTRAASFEFVDSIFGHFPLTRLALAVARARHPLPQGERVKRVRGYVGPSRKRPVQEPGRAAWH
jgi:hypothetical protein